MEKFLNFLKQNNINFALNEPMKNHTSFKIGGNADIFISPKNINECSDVILECNNEKIPYIIVGRGSNLLVRDEGIKGVVISISNSFSEIKALSDTVLCCQAGASLASVCSFALENSLTGMEFAYGIPGNIGGAIYMNAGAYGGEMKDIVVSCEYLDQNGKLQTISAEELDFSYRHSFFSDKNYIIVSVTLELKKGNAEEIKEKMTDILKRRKEKQPLEFPSAGSTFKRPEGSYASLLVDECGLKGMRVGDAQVSEKHAGFIINRANATAKDVLELIEKVQTIVKEKTGYYLEPEVKVI